MSFGSELWYDRAFQGNHRPASQVARMWPRWPHIWPDSGRLVCFRVKVGRLRPNAFGANNGRNRRQIGRFRATFLRCRDFWSNSGQALWHSGQFCSIPGQVWLIPGKLWLNLVKCCSNDPSSNSVLFGASYLAHTWLLLGQLGRCWPNVSQDWAHFARLRPVPAPNGSRPSHGSRRSHGQRRQSQGGDGEPMGGPLGRLRSHELRQSECGRRGD